MKIHKTEQWNKHFRCPADRFFESCPFNQRFNFILFRRAYTYSNFNQSNVHNIHDFFSFKTNLRTVLYLS